MLESLGQKLLMGTRRAAPDLKGESTYMDALFNDIAKLPVSPEEQMLHQCALVGAFETAGYLPEAGRPEKEPAPAEVDNRQLCSPRAARVFETALKKPLLLIVRQWIDRASRQGRRPPFHLLPDLLRLATKIPAFRGETRAYIGPRGRWLAGANAKWRWILDDEAAPRLPDNTQWEEGSLDERSRYLAAIREKDPPKARELIQSVLSGESAKTRAAFIARLDADLSDEDEPFLEVLLDDRSVEVRRTAAILLSRLPASALAGRMFARMENCVSIEKKFLTRTLRIEPPEKMDAAMKRDGIMDSAAGDLGSRAAMFMRITAATPLSWWRNRWGLTPEEILKGARKSNWEAALVLGLAEAASTQHDSVWIKTLLNAELPGKIKLDPDRLIRSLPPDELTSWVIGSLAAERTFPLRYMLTEETDAGELHWSRQLTDAALDAVKAAVCRQASHWQLKNDINAMGSRIHPDRLGSALHGWPEDHLNWPYYAEHTHDFFEVVKLRLALYEELT